MVAVRILEPGDEEALERFLASRPDTTVFLRSNWRKGGLAYEGAAYQGTYAAAFEGDEVVAVASHVWLGGLILEAPVHLEAVATAALRASGRPLKGLIGTLAQTDEAFALLGVEGVPMALDTPEDLFSLALDDLAVPPALAAGEVRLRVPREEEFDLLVAWRMAYAVELLGESHGPALVAQATDTMRRWLADGSCWVLEKDDAPVSLTGFNAAIPDCVQIGGVWTPPELRSRGYARCAVAASLLGARERGVARSILFTTRDNLAAKACYLGLGYVIVGDYALRIFRDPVTLAL